ncbi:DUF992 domain-containing protein [Rhodoplanes sp. Z2-YC6860]|uniref:DUF992 domain-containing protein n=1 Tax=Rhodoplanes sp. Z2-YC6860 TaxID=674703 RepID=UPI00078EB15E|nr:DUF992 domain-containing protein [Rhodoplanes sp. Z2-YC6860]AMN43667.1 hypothetical protein RHPLAN_52450 [Rhodoplanes sp. Z2-YC6860]
MPIVSNCGASLLFACALVSVMAVPSLGQQKSYTRSGVLSCKLAPTVGLVVGSRQKIGCRFTPDGGGPSEAYAGAITRIGLDLGVTAGGAMAWAVLTSAHISPRGGLAGRYVGASGDIALGIGAGANVMIGGSNKAVALQPVSVEGQVGVNIALGVAGLELQAAR